MYIENIVEDRTRSMLRNGPVNSTTHMNSVEKHTAGLLTSVDKDQRSTNLKSLIISTFVLVLVLVLVHIAHTCRDHLDES